MADKIHGFMPATAEAPTDRQRLILRYTFGVLLDLAVLGLADEFSDRVMVASFSWTLVAAILLQALLKATIAIEHQVALYFKARPGAFMKFMRFFGAWFVLFLSKFVILEALSFVLGDKIHFEGILHGIIPLIIVVVIMLVLEEVFVRLIRLAR